MRVTARQRYEAILADAFSRGEVTVRDLSASLGASEATIRRDLHTLAERGELELVHGGAVLPRKGDFSFRSKARRNVEAKRLAGRLAADLIDDGDQIFLDSGTTCFEMAGHLKRKRGLSVIVNSARLALELDSPNLEVILLGGQYRPDRMDTIGPLAHAALDQLRGYAAYIGADGLSREFGLTAGDVESAYMYRLAVENAREVNLIVDHSKFAAASLCRIVGWERVTRVVTDRPPSPEWADFLKERNIEIVTGQPVN